MERRPIHLCVCNWKYIGNKILGQSWAIKKKLRLLSKFYQVDQINLGHSLPLFFFQFRPVYFPGHPSLRSTFWVGSNFITMILFSFFFLSYP